MDIRDLKAAGDHAVNFGFHLRLKTLIKVSGIYAIKNKITGHLYIGSAIYIGSRLHNHRKKLRVGAHPNKYLQSAWNKYWEQSFEFVILEYVENLSLLLHCEDSWIEQNKCYDKNYGYNVRKIANSNLGLKFSEETKLKQSLAGKGHSRNKGRVPTIEHRAKISASMKGIKHSSEHVAKRVAANSRPDKWPHGYKCKCKPCMKLKSQAIRAKQKANAAKEI